MAGFLTGVFGGGDQHAGDHDANEQNAAEQQASAEAEVQLSAEANVSNEMSGSYDSPDGSSGGWSRSDEVNFETDLDASVSTDTLLTIESGGMG